MKILYFHQHFSTPKGSTGIRSYEMSRALLAKGHEVTMVCGSYSAGSTELNGEFLRGRRDGYIHGIRVIELELNYANSDGLFKRARTFMLFALRSILISTREEYDLIFATSTPLTAALPGIAGKLIRRKPFVFEVRDLWPELPREMGVIKNPLVLGLMGLLESLAYKTANKVIGLAPGIVAGIEKKGTPASNTVLIPNGCDLDLFDGRGDSWRPAEVADDDMLAVFAGTHGDANGLGAVLLAAEQLKSMGINDIKIALIGEGKLKAELMAEASQKELDNVLFLDPVNKIKLAGLLNGADVGLQLLRNVPAFYFGTSPNKFFDYIAAGLPVICNYPGWVSEMITEHGCGFVAEPDNPKSLAESLITARDNKNDLPHCGNNARDLAESQFARSKLATHFVDTLESISHG